MFKEIISDILGLLYPPLCPVCGDTMSHNEYFVCTACRYRAPMTRLWMQADNPMIRRLDGLLPVRHASAFLWFVTDSRWQELIHKFKYQGKWLYARRLGEWFGGELVNSGLYGDIDTIIPIPLHRRKRLSRRYNQAEYIADGIASVLGVKVDRQSVVRRVNNPSQTLCTENERWNNVDGIFEVRNPEALRGKHILLVDDVFTTGATMVSCGTAILRSTGWEDVQLSIAAIAATKHSMAIDK